MRGDGAVVELHGRQNVLPEPNNRVKKAIENAYNSPDIQYMKIPTPPDRLKETYLCVTLSTNGDNNMGADGGIEPASLGACT